VNIYALSLSPTLSNRNHPNPSRKELVCLSAVGSISTAAVRDHQSTHQAGEDRPLVEDRRVTR